MKQLLLLSVIFLAGCGQAHLFHYKLLECYQQPGQSAIIKIIGTMELGLMATYLYYNPAYPNVGMSSDADKVEAKFSRKVECS